MESPSADCGRKLQERKQLCVTPAADMNSDLRIIKAALTIAAFDSKEAGDLLARIEAAGITEIVLVERHRVAFGIVPLVGLEERQSAGRRRIVVEFDDDPRESWRRKAWYIAEALRSYPWFKERRPSTHHLSNIIAAALAKNRKSRS